MLQPSVSVPGLDDALATAVSRKPILALDFDGTLAPIVDRPEDARLPESTVRALARLSRQCPVAIVTGRSVDDVTGRLGFTPWRVIGNHGGECPFHPERSAELRKALNVLRLEFSARSALLEPVGIVVEDKNQSIALHYRRANHGPRAVALLKECVVLARKAGIRVVGGKCVVNFVPPSAPDKGQAVRALLDSSDAETVIYAGDDVNDEPVFAGAPSEWLTIKVGRVEHTGARFVVEDAEGLSRCLERLLELFLRHGMGEASLQGGDSRAEHRYRGIV